MTPLESLANGHKLQHPLQLSMEQNILKIVSNCLIHNIYSYYIETSGGQSSDLYLTVVPF